MFLSPTETIVESQKCFNGKTVVFRQAFLLGVIYMVQIVSIHQSSKNIEQQRDLITRTASFISDEAFSIANNFPNTHDSATEYFLDMLLTANKKGCKEFTQPTNIAGLAAFALYTLAPWGTFDNKRFHFWCTTHQISSEETSFLLSMVREFSGWEPAKPRDYAWVIELDRALIRGARVGAKSMEADAFVDWLGRNPDSIPDASMFYDQCRRLLLNLQGVDNGSQITVPEAKQKLTQIARIVLRDIGRHYGRSGLNSVRRQIGAPPSARRPSNGAIGALYSETVFGMSKDYLDLSASEREAFKHLLSKLDTGASIEVLQLTEPGKPLT